MRIPSFILFLLATSICVSAQDIIPYPQRMDSGEGSFTLKANTPLRVAPVFQREATVLRDLVRQTVGPATQANGSSIEIDDDPAIGTPEAYVLTITP
jgi:hypothetical protein